MFALPAAIRMPSGERLNRRFPKDAAVARLYDLCIATVRASVCRVQFASNKAAQTPGLQGAVHFSTLMQCAGMRTRSLLQ